MKQPLHRPATIAGLGLRPLLTAGVVTILATAIALCLPPLAAVIGAGVLLLGLLVPCLRIRWGVLLLAALCLLTTAAHRYTQELPLRALEGTTDTIVARVVDTPRHGSMYTVRVLSAHRVPTGTRLALYCAPGCEPYVSDVLVAEVSLQPPATDRRGDRIFLYAFPQGKWDASATVAVEAKPSWLSALRSYFLTILQDALPGEEGLLLSALCLGQKDAVSDMVRDTFRHSGLSHLLVVSGLHLSIIAVALRSLLRRLGVGYRTSAALALPLIWCFAGVVGAGSSVLRAAIACSVWLVGFILYRRHNGLNAWGLAATLLLLTDPYRLLHIGFQLSFAATAGVLMVAPRLCRYPAEQIPPATRIARVWNSARQYLRNGSAVCIGATLCTLPLTVWYFNGLSLTALPANLLAVVPAGWALSIGWLGLLCGAVPFLGWISQPLLYAAGLLTRWLQWVARLCGTADAFVYTPHLWQKLLITALCAVLFCGIALRIPWKRVVAAAVACGLCLTVAVLPLYSPASRLTVMAQGTYTAILLQEKGQAVLIADHSGALRNVSEALHQQGVTRLDAICITDGAPANVATLHHLWEQYDHPTVITPDTEGWHNDLSAEIRLIFPNDPWYWGTGSLTYLSSGWWRWQNLLIGTDPSAPRPEAAALTVYTSLPDVLPEDGWCVISHHRRSPPAQSLPEDVLLITEETMTLTVRKNGEWSVLPWL